MAGETDVLTIGEWQLIGIVALWMKGPEWVGYCPVVGCALWWHRGAHVGSYHNRAGSCKNVSTLTVQRLKGECCSLRRTITPANEG